MNMRCYRCGWSFSLSREAVGAALANASAPGAKHHVEHCPRCRQVLKIPLDQLKRSLPPGWRPAEQPATPAPLAEVGVPAGHTETPGVPSNPPAAPLPAAPEGLATPVKGKSRRRHTSKSVATTSAPDSAEPSRKSDAKPTASSTSTRKRSI